MRLQFLTCFVAVLPVTAASLPSSRPEDVGLSAQGLARIHETIQRHIAAHEMSGAVTLVARKGRVAHFEAQGMMDREAGTPMRRDGLFWVQSMSKPVTTVAILMLAEEGKLRLNDPVSRFIPAFHGMRVAVLEDPGAGPDAEDLPSFYTVPAAREITIQDLLTHVSGLASGGAVSTAQKEKLDEEEEGGTLAEYIPRLATTALDFQPGSRWSYSPVAAFETLGRVVEIASGQTLEEFLRQRIFEPLGMKDTGFHAAGTQTARLATLYDSDSDGLTRVDAEEWDDSNPYFSGSGGLMSDAEDYAEFAQMLLNEGELDGKRLLSPKSVELMHSVVVPNTVEGLPKGISFGLGVKVVTDPAAAGSHVAKGSFGWYGYYGTYFWVDPKEQVVAVLMIQTEGENQRLEQDFENAVAAALVN